MGDLPEWVRDLRVGLMDERAAYTITPAGLLRYLSASGWAKTNQRVGIPAELWSYSAGPGPYAVLVPLDATYADYNRRVIDLTREIAEREGRGAIGVISDLRDASRAVELLEPDPGQEALDV